MGFRLARIERSAAGSSPVLLGRVCLRPDCGSSGVRFLGCLRPSFRLKTLRRLHRRYSTMYERRQSVSFQPKTCEISYHKNGSVGDRGEADKARRPILIFMSKPKSTESHTTGTAA